MRTYSSRSAFVAAFGIAVLASGVAWAQEGAAPSAGALLGGGILQLLLAGIQLCIAMAIAAFAIKKGFDVLSGLLNRAGKNLDIWAEIRNKNIAVALMCAGVVISYCHVIGSGIDSMSNVLGAIARQSIWSSLVGLVSACINLVVAIIVASFAITVVFRVMDKLTKDLDEVAELKANNIAVGTVYCGLIIGVSFLVSAGVTSIGMGVNAVLVAILKMAGVA
jgi:uncharacterized membrane protein YjfL (UPF0719 family)